MGISVYFSLSFLPFHEHNKTQRNATQQNVTVFVICCILTHNDNECCIRLLVTGLGNAVEV